MAEWVKRRRRGLSPRAQVFQMAATAVPAIRSPEPRHRDFARRHLVERAFVAIRTKYHRHADARRVEQIVDMPTERFFTAQMPRDARLEIAPGGAGVDIVPGRERELAMAADSYA